MATVSTRATITGCDSNHCSAAAPPCRRFSNLPLWLRPRLTALLLPSKTGVASPFCYRSTRSWVVEPSGSPGLHAPSAPVCSLRGRLAGLIPLLQAASSTTNHLAGLTATPTMFLPLTHRRHCGSSSFALRCCGFPRVVVGRTSAGLLSCSCAFEPPRP